MLIHNHFIPICSSGTLVFELFSSFHSLLFTLQLPKSNSPFLNPLITLISLLCMHEPVEAHLSPQTYMLLN